MVTLINDCSDVCHVLSMKNSEIEGFIQIAYKRESNREILRDRILRGKTYAEIISDRFPEYSSQSERVQRRKINDMQKLEKNFYRIVRRTINTRPGGYEGRKEKTKW